MTIKKILTYSIPISLIAAWFISFEWISESVVDGPNLHGLIYPHRSDAIGSSFAYEFYLKGILINFPLYILLGTLIYWIAIKRIVKRKIRNGIIIGLWLISILIYIPSLIFISEYRFSWDYDFPVEYKEIKLCKITNNPQQN